jgi:transcriptional regulator with XRE-family HTH domain
MKISAPAPEEMERAARFRQIREHFGKNQIEFARELGLGDITWQNYERGKSRPTSSTLNAINRKLNINLNWLSFGMGAMFNDAAAASVMENPAAGIAQAKRIDEDKLFRLLLSGLNEIYAGVGDDRLPEADYAALRAHALCRRIVEMTENNVAAHKAATEFLEMEERIAKTLK